MRSGPQYHFSQCGSWQAWFIPATAIANRKRQPCSTCRRLKSCLIICPGNLFGFGRTGVTSTRFAKKAEAKSFAIMPASHRILDPNQPTAPADLCALAVMTKAPRAGHVKTRLVPPLSHDEAAQLNACFLRDTAAAIQVACDSNAVGI